MLRANKWIFFITIPLKNNCSNSTIKTLSNHLRILFFYRYFRLAFSMWIRTSTLRTFFVLQEHNSTMQKLFQTILILFNLLDSKELHTCLKLHMTVTYQLFKPNPHKMLRHTQTIRQLLLTNCLSVFEHFVGLVLKRLIYFNPMVSFWSFQRV